MFKKILSWIRKILYLEVERYTHCVFCGKKLKGNQRKFCSDKCNGSYYRYIEKFGCTPNKNKQSIKLRNKYLNDPDFKKKVEARRESHKLKKLDGKCYFCSKKARHGHHPNYDLPHLRVPLCMGCHRKLHSILKISKKEV